MILMTSMHLLFNFKVEALFDRGMKSSMSVHMLSQHIWAKMSNSVSLSRHGYGKSKIQRHLVVPVNHSSDG